MMRSLATPAIWEAILLITVVFGVFFGPLVFPIFFLSLCILVITDRSGIARAFENFPRLLWLLFTMVTAFMAYFAAVAAMRWVGYDITVPFQIDGVVHPGEWVLYLVVTLLLAIALFETQFVHKGMTTWFLPVFIVACSFAAAGYIYFHFNEPVLGSACRTGFNIMNPNILAFFLSILICLAFAYLISVDTRKKAALAVVAIGMLMLVILTGSRMAILSLTFTILVISFVSHENRARTFLQCLCVLVGAFAIGLLIVELIGCGLFNRFRLLGSALDADVSFSTANRVTLWSQAIEALRTNWLWGVGFQFEPTVNPKSGHIHNQYLSWWLWGGLPGLVLAVTPFVTLLYYGWVRAGVAGLGISFAYVGFAGLNFMSDSIVFFSTPFAQFMILFAVTIGLIEARRAAAS
ncbi:MAG: O-antigen ligase family protein [Pseudomonadota bacterium]